MDDLLIVWVFHGVGGHFTSGIFTDRNKAEAWISQHKLSGLLTLYPVDRGVYDWSIEKGLFEVKKGHQSTAVFIQKFSSASQEHYHYQDGKQEA